MTASVSSADRDRIRAEAFEEAAKLVEFGCDRDARMHLVDELLRQKARQVRALAAIPASGTDSSKD